MKSNTEISKKPNKNTFISISIFFKVFKNLCLNELKKKKKKTLLKAYQLFWQNEFKEKNIITIKNIACIP